MFSKAAAEASALFNKLAIAVNEGETTWDNHATELEMELYEAFEEEQRIKVAVLSMVIARIEAL